MGRKREIFNGSEMQSELAASFEDAGFPTDIEGNKVICPVSPSLAVPAA